MKKIIAIMLALVLAVPMLAACGSNGGNGGESGSAGSAPPASTSIPASAGDNAVNYSAGPIAGETVVGDGICVDGSSGGSGDGTPANPYHTIQAAVDAASSSNIDIIKIAGGTYREAVRISQKKARLLGGFASGSDFTIANPQANETIIEGTAAAPCILVYIDEQAVSGSLTISGFTIRKGQRGIELSGAWSGYLDNIIIENNIIEENGTKADDQIGGGIGLEGNNVTIQNNLIRDNEAMRGAAIGGTSESISDFLIAGNLIENNKGYGDHAGGVIISGTGTIIKNVFDGNVIDAGSDNGYGWGGAITIVNYDTNKLITLSHNVWRNNRAPSRGGAVFVDEAAKVLMANELFYGNTCDESGSAIYVDQAWTLEPSILYMENCTVSGNSGGAALYVEASSAEVQNCIFWNNGTDFEVVSDGSLAVDYTLSGQGYKGTGNITSDPLFADASGGDFHVQSKSGRFVPATGEFANDSENSPAIDAGNPSSGFSEEPEPNGGRVNLGCFGNTGEASKSAGT